MTQSFNGMALAEGVVVLTTENARVIRIEREQIPYVNLGDSKGIYILWGSGTFYVGQGQFSQRLGVHINNPDKPFQRVFICAVNAKRQEIQDRFNHYLLDIEGYMDRLLTDIHGSHRRQNRQTTDTTPLLEEHQQFVKECEMLLDVLDATLLTEQIEIESVDTYEDESEYKNELAYSEELIETPVIIGDVNSPDIALLKAYLNGQAIEDKEKTRLALKGYIQEDGSVRPLINVWIISRKVRIEDPLEQLTEQQQQDIASIFDIKKVAKGYVMKEKGIPNKVYELLVASGNLIPSYENKQFYFIKDEIMDTYM